MRFAGAAEFMEFWGYLKNETPRGVAVVVAAYFDDYLKTHLPASTTKRKEDFSVSIDRALKVGLISTIEHHDLHIIRQLRNSFAHNMRVSRFDIDRKNQVESLTIWKRVADRDFYRNKLRSPRSRLQYVAAALAARVIKRKGQKVSRTDDPKIWTDAYPSLSSR